MSIEFQALYGKDPRQYLKTATEFIKNENGALTGLKVVKVDWEKNEQGGFTQIFKPETAQILPAQLVLIAMGFTGPEDLLVDTFGIVKDPRGNVMTDNGKYVTNKKGVFAAGDMRRGQSLVVWAIQEGRAAAKECDQYLRKL